MKFVLFTLFLCGFVLEINAGRGFQNPRALRVACEESVAEILCVNGSISVISAKYGRSDQTTCSDGIPDDQTDKTDCSTRADLVFQRCDGESMCTVFASSSVFGDPCVGTYKYLEVLYRCEIPFVIDISDKCTLLPVNLVSAAALILHHNKMKFVLFTLFLCGFILKVNGKSSSGACLPEEKSLVACEGRLARLHCGEGQAIYVTRATYGRTEKKTCRAGRPADQLENTECSTDTEEVGERCNGKQWCKVKASDYVFRDPCYGTYKYLEVEYICYEVPQLCPE
ncbi:L-rhamnose-binding lectin CSL2-like [Gambusia affinis]|uniref:L-rhamnose-binding lectin CSL2-like n=1 Tax=Gambusia affinis TaxID=33528 RepID=UPI001CDC5DCD|nr:L-rhamnose-binding lectin CSL2-like [Gambusia affinis]